MRIALVIAGGKGTRMDLNLPKQFYHIQGKPIFIHTLEVFERCKHIDRIVLVTLKDWIDTAYEYCRKHNITKLDNIVTGGDSNHASIHNGLLYLENNYNNDDMIMIHAANRPIINNQLILDNIKTYDEFGNAMTATPCYEVSFFCSENKTKLIPRENLFQTQTPQSISLEKLKHLHKEAESKNIEGASTCELLYQLNEEIFFSKGSTSNIKVTTNEDLRILEYYLNRRKDLE